MLSLGSSRNLLATLEQLNKARESRQHWTALPSLAQGQSRWSQTCFLFMLLALGSANQAHCHTTATGAALKPDWRKSSFCRRSTQLQGKNYCGKPFRTSQGARNLCQSLGMHSKHPQPAVRIEFFTLKIPWALEVCEIFSIAYQAVVFKMMSLAAQPA